MRPPVSWITQSDDRILEFYHETGISAPPSVVAFNLDLSDTHAKRRISKLSRAGLLKKVSEKKGYYRIRQLGQKYIDGEVSGDKLEGLAPDDN